MMIVLGAVAFVVFLAIDMVWLGWLGRGFYVDEIGTLLRTRPDFVAAGAFYVLYIAGLSVFVLQPAQAADSLHHALLYGAFFGLIAYGTYDLTNLAVMKGFTLKIALIDLAWGAALTSLTSAVTIWLARHLPV